MLCQLMVRGPTYISQRSNLSAGPVAAYKIRHSSFAMFTKKAFHPGWIQTGDLLFLSGRYVTSPPVSDQTMYVHTYIFFPFFLSVWKS
jgi:hypothetical protein